MANESKGPSFPEGTFRAVADWQSVSLGTADGQNEQISVRLRVADTDPHPNAVGMSILWFGNFANQQGTEITCKALQAMGWDGKSPIGVNDGKNGCLTGLGGTEVEMVVRHETYAGKTRAKVAFVNAPAGRFEFKKALDDNQIAKLNERIGRHMGATLPRQETPRRQEPASAHRPEHRRYTVNPNAPPTEPIGTRPTSGGYNPPMSDEDRLRAIDQGKDVPPPPDSDDDGRHGSDDEIPF